MLKSELIPTSFIRGNSNEPPATVPQAFINYVFFDACPEGLRGAVQVCKQRQQPGGQQRSA
ncbi:MAG: hypothetical protein MUF24_07290 [Chitinophagaceae bacterium]|nr:hypothetical protein [Chitinophagaceae bacterium]